MRIYMKLTIVGRRQVRGVVTEKGHEGWIELLSCNFGTGSGGTSAAVGYSREGRGRRAAFPDGRATKVYDEMSSVELYELATRGQPLTADIDFVKDGVSYLKATIEETVISSYSGPVGGDPPLDSFAFTVPKITYRNMPRTSPDISHLVRSLLNLIP